EVETSQYAPGNWKCRSAGVTVGAVEPVAHRRLAGVAVGSAAQDVIKEGERFQLPRINRQVETRRGEDQPLAISRRAGFFKKLIAAELMQVEVAEILHRHEWNFDLAKLGIGPGRHDVLLAGFTVDHP